MDENGWSWCAVPDVIQFGADFVPSEMNVPWTMMSYLPGILTVTPDCSSNLSRIASTIGRTMVRVRYSAATNSSVNCAA